MSFFGKKIFVKKDIPFGLDISDLSIKVVQLCTNGTREEVRSFGRISLPPGSIEDGEIKNEEQVVSTIKRAVAESGPRRIHSRQVYCSLPEAKAFLRIISIPKMNQDEIAEAIKWEMEENIPLGIDQVYYDWQILEKNFSQKHNSMSVLVVAVSRAIVDRFIGVVERAGLEVVGMEIESVAQARCLLLENTDISESVLIVDMGDKRTTLLFAVDGVIAFTSSISVSSQMFTDALAKKFGITAQRANDLKIEKGIGIASQQDEHFQALSPMLENFASQIQTSINFFVTGLGYATDVNRIILCGGGGNMKGLPVYLSKETGRKVERGNVWVNFRLDNHLPLISQEQSIQYSTAIGLALQGLSYDYEDIS